jgi:hypothetical protein
MPHPSSLLYHVAFSRAAETDRVVAEVPTLDLADYGVDVPEALDRLQAMVTFHPDCLVQEGKPIPAERREDAGFYLRAMPPPHAAWYSVSQIR